MAKKCRKDGCERNCYGEFCLMHKPRKPIKKRGKRTDDYEQWRDTVAIPYLDEHFGRVCADCGGARCGNVQLDVDHIKTRGGHQDKKKDLSNVQYLGRFPCHYEKTNHLGRYKHGSKGSGLRFTQGRYDISRNTAISGNTI